MSDYNAEKLSHDYLEERKPKDTISKSNLEGWVMITYHVKQMTSQIRQIVNDVIDVLKNFGWKIGQ